jgi:hypothetical protein
VERGGHRCGSPGVQSMAIKSHSDSDPASTLTPFARRVTKQGRADGCSRLLEPLLEGGGRGKGCACTISAAARQRHRREHLRHRCVSAVFITVWLSREARRDGTRRRADEGHVHTEGPSRTAAGAWRAAVCEPLVAANPGPEPKRAESTRELEWRVLGISRESSRLQLTRILGSSLPGRLNGRLPVSPGTRPTQLVVQAYSSSRVRTMRAFLIRWWTRASHTGGATLRGSFWGGGELGEGARGKSG